MIKKMTKNLLALIPLLAALTCPLFVAPAGAFSVDVKNLYYSDPSGPREINYDFSAGTVGDGTTLPVNSIGIPGTNPPILQKNAADIAFMFGNIPIMGTTSVTLNTTSQICTIATAQGGAILSGASAAPPATQPPDPATSWTYALKFQNFSGMTDPAKTYRFEIGASAPAAAGPQPRFWGVWNTSGRLELSTAIFDEAGMGTTIWSGTTPVVFTGLTPTATAIELKIVNSGATVTFSYRLNADTAWTDMPGVYTIANGIVFNSLPARFPYFSLREATPEDPFQVSSQHWSDAQGDVYKAWPRVNDPGQALYSGVTLNSTGYLTETPLAYNSAAGYWAISGTLFSDDFNDNTVDTAKWATQGTSVTESGGIFKVDQAAANAGGTALSRAIIVNPYAPITVQRKATVHYANNNFDGVFALHFGDTPNVTSWNDSKISVVVSHANYNSTTVDTAPANGFYLGRYPARFTPSSAATTSAIWDTEFVEKIVYNPVSGLAELYINGVQKATINLGALPAGARYLKVYLDAWGLNTGHYNYSDDLTVSQPWTGGDVFLSISTTPPSPPASFPVFNFTATKKAGGTEAVSKTITGYVTDFATNLLPTGDVTNARPTFSWTGISGATFYSVQVSDANYNRIWNKNNIPAGTTSAVYNDDSAGPALVSGQTYNYEIVSSIVTGGVNNDSFTKGSFTYTGTVAETIAFNGWVKSAPSWPTINDAAAVAGVTVSAYLPGTTPTLIGTVNADAGTGAFALTGLPKLTTFYLQVQPPAGYMPVLSKFMNWTENIQALLPFALFTMGPTGQYVGFGNTPGTGMIIGRVALENSPTTFLSGATIEAREWIPGTSPTLGAIYPVTYTSGSSTAADGIYMVKSVPAGKLVQLTATLANHTFAFNGAIIPVQSGFISEDSFFATATQQTVNLIQNGDFSGGLNNWIVNPALLTGTPPWNPLVGDGTVSLHPLIANYNGLILYQNLNITVIAGQTFNLSMNLTKVSAPTVTGNTVAAYLTYVDGNRILQKVKILNPGNDSITTNTLLQGTFVVPTGATKIVKLEIAKEYSGEFHVDNIVLSSDGVNVSPGVLKGDINGDGYVNLADSILALKVNAGMAPSGIRSDYAASGADVNTDGQIGLQEVIYILQFVSSLRQ